IGMSAKGLRLVNFIMFAISRHVTTLQTAFILLGENFIYSLVLTAEVFRAYEHGGEHARLRMGALLRHALLVADIAASIAAGASQAGSAFIAAMLPDVGRQAMLDGLPDEVQLICPLAQERGVPMHDEEEEVMGESHTKIGAYLLR